MGGSCNSEKIAKVLLWIAIPVLIVSVAMVFVFNEIYNVKLGKEITLGEGTLVTNIWKDIPLPIYEKLYFFNITNEEAFLDGTEPLNVTEVGPYTFKSNWVKEQVQWHPNKTVSYKEIRTYHFVPEMSNGTEEDIINTLNGPLIIASSIAGKMGNDIVNIGLSAFFKLYGETLITQKTIKELVYEGYEDMIIKEAPYIQKDIPYKNGTFSWLYGKNASDDGLFTVFTGADDASKTNFINNWNGQERLNFWKGNSINETSKCNMLEGTSIETGPPIDGDQDTYTFFQTIFCRSLTFNYTEDIFHHDIPSKRFRSTYDLFANSTENPGNECFEVNKEHASGILDVSPCQFKAPVFMSFPHFHFADSSYLNFVNGLKPNAEQHGSHIDLEPITGMSVDLSMKFQINIEVSKVPLIFQFHNVRNGIYPVFWVELDLELDEHMADFLKSNVRTPKIIAYSILIALAIISLIMVVLAACFLTVYKKKKEAAESTGKQSLIKNEALSQDSSSYIINEKPRLNIISEQHKTTNSHSNLDDFPSNSMKKREEALNTSTGN